MNLEKIMLKKVFVLAVCVLAASPVFAKSNHSRQAEPQYKEFHLWIDRANNYVTRQDGKWVYCTKGIGCVSEQTVASGYQPNGEPYIASPVKNNLMRQRIRELDRFFKH